MQPSRRSFERTLSLLLTLFLSACADTPSPTTSLAREPNPFSPLDVELPDSIGGGLLVTRNSTAATEREFAAMHPDIAAAVEEDESALLPIIFRKETAIGCKTEGATSILWWQAIMTFIGNRARQSTNINLQRQGTPIPLSQFVEEESWFLPWKYTFYVNSSLPLGESCGHSAMATTHHRAWSENQLPIPPHNAFLSSEASSSALSQPQNPCADVTREGVISGGGAGGEKMTDEWYLCWWEVWYSPSGREIARYFLGCEPL